MLGKYRQLLINDPVGIRILPSKMNSFWLFASWTSKYHLDIIERLLNDYTQKRIIAGLSQIFLEHWAAGGGWQGCWWGHLLSPGA
jgi:hypothetical protein